MAEKEAVAEDLQKLTPRIYRRLEDRKAWDAYWKVNCFFLYIKQFTTFLSLLLHIFGQICTNIIFLFS